MVFLKKAYSSLAHLPKCTLFVSQNFAQVLFSISIGTAVIPKRNEKQRLCKLFFFREVVRGQTRSTMGDVQMANSILRASLLFYS